MKEDQDPTSLSKPKMKMRLARKYATAQPKKVQLANRLAHVVHHFLEEVETDWGTPDAAGAELFARLEIQDELELAYVAGFEKAKALIIDHAQRSIDERIENTDYKEASGGLNPSEVLAMIGEDQ